MPVKSKKRGFGLEMKSFSGKNGTYLVLRTSTGAFHTFLEVEAKEAARQCGARGEGNTRQMWSELWKRL
jgi:hypothetical protein